MTRPNNVEVLAFALELGFLPGRDKLPAGAHIQSLMIV